MSQLPLVDRFGRVAKDLRLSVTDVCNLRCTYCLPATGVVWLPRDEILSVDELARLAHIGITRLGIEKIRLTGGEPLTRPDLAEIVRAIAGPHPGIEIALTTNGVGLAPRAAELAAAGVGRVNISLDTVHPETFLQITRRGWLPQVLAAVEACVEARLAPVKVNAVLTRGVNDDGLIDLLDYCLAHSCELRFIEQMPIGAPRDWARQKLVTAEETRAAIEERYQLEPVPGRGAAPAARWRVLDEGRELGTVGIIASVTEPFCQACDRTRISADGQLRSCLFSQEEADLRSLLRNGSSDEEIARAWAEAMYGKPFAHGGVGRDFDDDYEQPARAMNAIGG